MAIDVPGATSSTAAGSEPSAKGRPDPDRTPLPESDAGPPENQFLATSAYKPSANDRTVAARNAVPADPSWTFTWQDDAQDLVALREAAAPKAPRDFEALAEAAVRIGDLSAMRELFLRMPSPPAEDVSWYDFQVRRGAWLCLLGERARGLRELAVAVRLGRMTRTPLERGDHPQAPLPEHVATAKLAALACGGPTAGAARDPALANEHDSLEVLRIPVVGPKRNVFRVDEIQDDAQLATIVTRGTPRIEEVVEYEAPCSGSRREHVLGALFFGPGTVLEGDPFHNWSRYVIGSLETLERGATKVEALAATAPHALPCPKDPSPETRAARADLPSALKRAAVRLWLLAAAESARRGDMPRALRDAAAAERLTAASAMPLSVVIHLLAHDTAAAKAVLDRSKPEANDVSEKVALELWRSLVAAQSGNAADAFAAATRANDLAAVGDRPKHPPWAGDLLMTTTWLRAAMAVNAKSGPAMLPPSALPKIESPGQMIEAASETSKTLDLIASSSPSARANARVARCYVGPHAPTRTETRVPWAPVLLIGAAVTPSEGEVEPWLDCAASFVAPARVYFYARGEAARMRGDAKAAALWESRSAAVNALIKDDATAILASLAGY